ncbi:MAG: glycosyltransferase family 4 protein [Pseudomonadota bacterium]
MSSGQAHKLRVLILADQCNPEWPSLPIVGYKYALALADLCDATIVTHERNRQNILKAGRMVELFDFIDTEYVARPLYKLSTFLRGGDQVAWSTGMIMNYLPYVEFERQALKRYKSNIKNGEYDIIHRITPMSPTLPSYISGRTNVPFVIGPLNGNLDWPDQYKKEQVREKERARMLRNLYKLLPFSSSTYKHADAIITSFSHTKADIAEANHERIVSMPEIGFDPEIFHATGRNSAFSSAGAKEFLYVGRLVPYKIPEAAVTAFARSEKMAGHVMRIIGTGPEEQRLRDIVERYGASERVIFDGWKSQAEVADAMRKADCFVFPSIRELGAGVVIEAMACGIMPLVVNYGAPGDLVGEDRGIAVSLGTLEEVTDRLEEAMHDCVDDPESAMQKAKAAQDYAEQNFKWSSKASFSVEIYNAIRNKRPYSELTAYA